jgi:hypothetical protein
MSLHVGLTNPVTGSALGPTDQRSQIKTFNIAPTWTDLVSSSSVFTFGGFFRQDRYNYRPSADPFADLALTSRARPSDRFENLPMWAFGLIFLT